MLKNKPVDDIGNKLEEAYLSKVIPEAPSDETIAKWVAIAEQRRAERRHRNRKLVSLAAVLLICVCVGVTCIIKQPRAVAGSSGGNKVESGMETVKTYSSIDEFPEVIKKDFFIFPEGLSDFKFVETVFNKNPNVEKISFLYADSLGDEIYIKEIRGIDESSFLQQIDSGYELKEWGNIKIYINIYSEDERKIYNFMHNNIAITINTNENVNEELIKEIIEEAVHS